MSGLYGREYGLKGCGQVLTIWNRYRSPESGKDEFVRHVIPALCKWKSSSRRGESRIATQSVSASVSQSLTVIIPYSEEYRPYDVWKEMGPAEKKRYFTLHLGDLIALGKYGLEITGEPPYTETDVRKAIGENCAVVSAFADNTCDGARKGGHYKVGCFYGFRSRV